jgi:hypothetical protein
VELIPVPFGGKCSQYSGECLIIDHETL